MSKIHQQLKKSLLEFKQIEKVESYYQDLTQRLKKESAQYKRLGKKLKKDERDVEQLEKTSMKSLFAKVLGNKEQQLEKERHEYLQTALKYNELGESLDLLTYELEVLEKKMASKEKVQTQFKKLMKMREAELMRTDPNVGRQLMRISKKIDRGHIVLKDIQDATAVGHKALKILGAMERQLRNARNWGQWDVTGGGRQSGWMKHQAIDRAKNLSYKAKHVLMQFSRELNEVYADARIRIHIDMQDFGRFTDIFFDNIISDWIVQQKIKRTTDDVIRVKNQVISALEQMKQEVPRVKREVKELQTRRDAVIMGGNDR